MFNSEKFAIVGFGVMGLFFYIYRLGRISRFENIELGAILLSVFTILPFAFYHDTEIIRNGISLVLGILVLYVIHIYSDASSLYLSKLWIFPYTALILFDVIWQWQTGADFFFGYEKLFGWKVTGPYPYVYIDTYALVFIPVAAYLRSIKLISKSQGIIVIIAWILMLILTGTRSAVLQLISTWFVVWLLTFNFKSKQILHLIVIVPFATLIYMLFLEEFIISVNPQFFERLAHLAIMLKDLDLEGADNRWLLWSGFFNALADWPHQFIFGHGFGMLLNVNDIYFKDPNINIDDFQNIWFDILFSIGVAGLILIIISSYLFYKKYIFPVQSVPAKRCQLFLFLWFLSPLSVQHKLMDVWYILNIVLTLAFVILIYKFNARKYTIVGSS